MHNGQWLTFIAVLLLTSCVSRQERDDMQARLAQMAQWNTDDTVFTARHTAEAQTLADWFDSHGTSNEQLRAHYILGRTYADRGETPRAVDSYLDAIAKADTTAADNDRGTGSCHIDGIGGRGETSWSVTGTCPRVMSATLPT